MEIVRYPEDISKAEFLDKYAARILVCIKEGMNSSYEQDFSEEGDKSWYYYLEKNLDEKVNYIIADDLNGIRGYLVWKQKGKEIHFYDLIISPDYQGDIITLRKLLREFAYDIYDLDAHTLCAYTNIKNERMNSILMKRGFTVDETKARGTVYKADIDLFIEKFV
jgi:hypothetical protein